ncbi:hypothetical protein APR41_04730 [Salegentibacter salinarum]|uniref:Uncharacterized protein n=1 Tax=Salegentibacter salinarum TaxID=447422 RepID=A0A2N0TRZ9_9FLAO|nr:hypothetical protein [Salegentibacter salinarum]PKD17519.1 hypothetical protein APR41_04730 [Salegentibacter salinarum]SKB48011.1 hypothetical protein SAMN05660903_00970 [Salegentibacter salinarum]
MKKFLVLLVLFALPIIAYMFFASGQNNFAKLPVLTKGVNDVSEFESLDGEPISLEDKISIVAFFGKDLDNLKGNTFNLDQKILEKYYEFKDFQFVVVLPEEAREEAEKFKKEFSGISETEKWEFIFGTSAEVEETFKSFDTPHQLENTYTPYVFIVDKDLNLRGRDEDEDFGKVYGYDSRSVAELSDKMNDDVKVILAEYRLALKKNNAERKNN